MRFKSKNILFVLIFVIFAFIGGYEVGHKGFIADYSKGGKVTISRVTPQPNVDFSLFWTVWDKLHATYFDKTKVVDSQMVYGAISGMVQSLGDPYTMFLPPSDNKKTNDDLQGNFSGVGIELGYKETTLAVIAPLPGTPAEKAGIKPGDLIIGIKDPSKNLDITTENINLSQAVDDIRGPTGSKVTLTLLREGTQKPIVVDLVRETINVPSVKLEYVGDNKDIVHLSLTKFGGDTMNEWQKTIQQITDHRSPATSIILDLRNNPGGYLQDAVDIAGEFLPKGSVVLIQQNGDNSKSEIRTDHEGIFVNSKVVILINGGSASASEILAGALRDDRKIELAGEKSFGKGTVQEPEDLDGGAGLHVTIAKWLTPNGTWVHGKGLDPDIKVTQGENLAVDDQLGAAIKALQ